MANRKMQLSKEGKELLDSLIEDLDIGRPQGIKIALAKGITSSKGGDLMSYSTENGWSIPDNIIKDNEFLLFKHVIINELQAPLSNDELHQYMIKYIEKGLRDIHTIIQEKASLEETRLAIL